MSTFNTDGYNLLSEVKYIRNKDLCAYDSNIGYEVIFTGEEAQGWDTPMGMEAAGPIGPFYLGVSSVSSCYLGRQFNIYPSFETESNWRFEIDLLLQPDKELIGENIDSLTARLQWKLESDADWDPDKYIDFEVIADGQWRRYSTIELRSEEGWIGNCVNFRLYPFINGQPYIWIYIRRMAFISPDLYRCKNPACSYYYSYSHNCGGAGSFANATSIIPLTTSGFSITSSQCRIGLDIDNYGIEYIDLNEASTVDGNSIAIQMSIRMSQIGRGGYAFGWCAFDESSRLFTIYTGTRGTGGSVRIVEGDKNDISKLLGFIDLEGNSNYISVLGAEPADLFLDKYSKIASSTLYQLVDATSPIITFDPLTPSTEIGRKDATSVAADNYYWDGAAYGKLLIDYLGGASHYGNIGSVMFNGGIVEGESLAVLLRPEANNSFRVIAVSEFFHGIQNVGASQLRSNIRNKYVINVNWDLHPGDVIGLYRCMPSVGKTWFGGSNWFYEKELRASWLEVSVYELYEGQIITCTAEDIKDYGYESLPLYGRSSQTFSYIGFDIVLRAEYGLESITFIGSEQSEICNYNLAKAFGTDVAARTQGYHTHWWECSNPDGRVSMDLNECLNTYALTDGVKVPFNMLTSWDQTDDPSDYNTYFYLTSDMPFYSYAVGYDGTMHSDTLLVETGPGGSDGTWGSTGWCFGGNAVPEGATRYYAWTTEQREKTPFWITFTFSNSLKFYISSVVLHFAEESNIKDFCWEYYVEPEEWHDHVWYSHSLDWTEGGTKPTIGDGTELGWVIFPDPTRVVIDNKYDMTANPYFAHMYVTRDLWDTYPDLTASDAQARGISGENLTWLSLNMQFPEVRAKKVRFFSWWHRSSKITEIEIYSKLTNVKSLVSALQLKISSIDSSFHTGRYETTTISGIRVLSELTSVMDTGFELYPTIEPTTTSGVVTAPLGMTANKIEVEVGALDVEISRILLKPHADTVKVTDANTSFITEIGNLDWQLIDEVTDPVYGTPQEYHVVNDSEELATLRLNLTQTAGLGTGLIYSTSLSGASAIEDPEIGPAASLFRTEDFDFSNTNSIQHGADIYTLEQINIDGARWFKKYNGTNWWEILEGAPFSSALYWNEKENSTFTSWSGSNIFRTDKFDINSTSLANLAVVVKNYSSADYWNAPTYFTNVNLNSNCSLKTTFQTSLASVSGVDILEGLVIYDQDNLDNYALVGLTCGNEVTRSSGDYVVYTCSGIKNYLSIPTASYGVIPKIIKQNDLVKLSYSNFSDPFVPLCDIDISSWSNNLRAGLFGDLVVVSGCSPNVFSQTFNFNYLHYETTGTSYEDRFDTYTSDFMNPQNISNTFSGGNMHQSEFFYSTSTDDIKIKTTTSGAPYIQAPFGDQYSRADVSLRLTDMNFLGASGTHTFRLRLEDPSYANAWINFNLSADKWFTVQTASGTTASGLFSGSADYYDINLTKNGSYFICYMESSTGTIYGGGGYLYDYFTVTGPLLNFKLKLSVITENTTLPTEVTISGFEFNFEDTTTSAPLCASRYDRETAWVACKLPACAPVSYVLIYGRNGWVVDGYKTCEHLSDTYASDSNWESIATMSSWVRFTHDVGGATASGLDGVKFYPEPCLAQIYNYPLTYINLTESKRDKVISFCSNTETVPAIAEYHTEDVSIDKFIYPVLILDLGKVFALSNQQPVGVWDGTYSILTGFPVMNLVEGIGKFSASDVDTPEDIEWGYYYYYSFGLQRRCLYSVNNCCQLPSEIGLPKHPYYAATPEEYYANGAWGGTEMPHLWFAFLPDGCDGWTTVGQVSGLCPYFYSGRFRWWLLTSDDYDTTSSGVQYPWHIDPLRTQPYDATKLPAVATWWESDTGTVATTFDGDEPVINFTYTSAGVSNFGINLEGCDLVRLTFDENWVVEDFLTFEFKVSNPSTIDAIMIKIGRDPDACWQFIITEGFSSSWTSFSRAYKAGYLEGDLFMVFERYFLNTNSDLATGYKTPHLYGNLGYIEILVADRGSNQVSFKKFKNRRCQFENEIDNKPALFLGLKDLLVIPPLGISSNRGTVEFMWLPSGGPIGLSTGEQRSFIMSLLTLRGTAGNGYSLTYKPVEGWSIFLFNPQTSWTITQRNNNAWSYYVAHEDKIAATSVNPGPFHVVLSWDANGLPGMYSTIALWVNDVLVLSEANYLIVMYPCDSMALFLGKSLSGSQTKSYSTAAPYASFSDLKVYNYSIGTPNSIRVSSRKPEDFLQLSLNGSTWADLTNGLPLLVKDVPAGDSVTFYARAKHFDKQTAAEFSRRTGYIVVEWAYD